MSVTTVRLQAEVEQHLEAIASRLHRSKGWVINQALSEYIEKQRLEQARWQQTLEAMESAAQGKVVDAVEAIAAARGVPMAQVLFATSAVGMIILPLMIFHQIQLMVCTVLAQRYARRPELPEQTAVQ